MRAAHSVGACLDGLLDGPQLWHGVRATSVSKMAYVQVLHHAYGIAPRTSLVLPWLHINCANLCCLAW